MVSEAAKVSLFRLVFLEETYMNCDVFRMVAYIAFFVPVSFKMQNKDDIFTMVFFFEENR